MTTRRDFIRGLLAAAVATQFPDIARAESTGLVDQGEHVLLGIRGKIIDAGASDYGNGWIRYWANYIPNGEGFGVDFGHLNGGRGLHAGKGDQISLGLPTPVSCRSGVMTMSAFVKRAEATQ